ncbi:hypothetical protein N7G274_010689 [Stereocaulon virgatum]|uniref:Methyltransferase domain-containing protein n=1 Tax=Stereocaulon virgatum TaxID=373712 RepID=A0ABR3ZZU2_9LECA
MSSNNTVTPDKPFTTPTASWFKPTITLDEIPKPALDLLMSCTGLPLDKIVSHVNEARAAAWLTAPYPCIGLYMFLDLHMSQHPLYPTLLSRLMHSPTTRLVDIGCGLGQDVRKLVSDGVPATQTYAVELKAELISAGQDLFMDGGRKQSLISFLHGDAVTDDMEQWKRKLDVSDGFEMIHTGALFHLFAWETQLAIARNLVALVHGSDEAVIFGWTFAAREAGLRSVGPKKEAVVYGHDEGSARRLWEEVGEATGTRWEVEVRIAWADVGEVAGLAKGGSWGDAEGNGIMWFSVRRV